MKARRLTPPGLGGVAIVACSGSGAAAALERAFVRARGTGLPEVGGLALGRVVDSEREAVDEVLLVRTDAEAFELGCHGGPGVVAQVLRVLRSAGAGGGEPRPADDRVRLEAWKALASASTELGCQVLLRQLNGALSREVQLLAQAPDAVRLRALLATARLGAALTTPPSVALIGPANAGKSSLLNALLGRERVLVDSEAGTTRDAVEATASLDGVPARLVDTAGQRATADAVEAAGIARGSEASRHARLRVIVLDATLEGDAGLELFAAADDPKRAVLSKIDLLQDAERAAATARVVAADPAARAPQLVSSVSGEGLAALSASLRLALVGDVDVDGPVVFTPRQVGLVEGALRALDKGDAARASRCLAAIGGT